MSERIEILKEVYAAFEFKAFAAGELDELMLRYTDPNFVFSPPAQYPDSGDFQGLEGAKGFFRMLTDVWEEWWFEPEEFAESGDQVVVGVRLHTLGKGSGVELDTQAAHLWEFSGTTAVGCKVYLDRAEGFAAAGLESRP